MIYLTINFYSPLSSPAGSSTIEFKQIAHSSYIINKYIIHILHFPKY